MQFEASLGTNSASFCSKISLVAGPQCSNYMKTDELAEEHKLIREEALRVFDGMANFGSTRSISKSKRDLMAKIDDDYEVYGKLNDSRNPLLGLEM